MILQSQFMLLFQFSKGQGDAGAGTDTVGNVKQEVAAALQESGLMGEKGVDLITTKIGAEVSQTL